MKPDLHTHTDRSDGVLSPERLLGEAERAGLTLLAITDHDTFEGSDEALRLNPPLPLIPGVELSLRDMDSLHLLAYGTAPGCRLRAAVARLRQRRAERADRMLDRLEALGLPIDRAELARRCQGAIGRPHMARMMIEMGYVSSIQEAFDRYLGHGRPAYVSSERLSMAEALPLIRGDGFVPVLAHPRELKLPDHQTEALIEQWQAMGLMGVEVYHPSARRGGFEGLARMARRRGLLVTGGSDFHQENDHKHGSLGDTADDWKTAPEDIAALLDALRRGQTEQGNDASLPEGEHDV